MKDIVVRAVKTFVQAFLAFVAAGAANVVNVSTAKQLVVAAGAAALSAAWNGILTVRAK